MNYSQWEASRQCSSRGVVHCQVLFRPRSGCVDGDSVSAARPPAAAASAADVRRVPPRRRPAAVPYCQVEPSTRALCRNIASDISSTRKWLQVENTNPKYSIRVYQNRSYWERISATRFAVETRSLCLSESATVSAWEFSQVSIVSFRSRAPGSTSSKIVSV